LSENTSSVTDNGGFLCSNLSSPPFPFHEDPALTSYGKKLVVFGYSSNPEHAGVGIQGAVFDTASNSWSTLPNPNIRISGPLRIVVIRDNLYLFGMHLGGVVGGVYSFSDNKWSQLELPEGLRDPGYQWHIRGFTIGTIESGEKILINGIRDGHYDYSASYHFTFDPVENLWTEVKSRAILRHLGKAINIGDNVYFAGEGPFGGLVTVLSLDSGKRDYLKGAPYLHPSAAAAAVEKKLIVWGGTAGDFGMPQDQGYIFNTEDSSFTELPKNPHVPRARHGATSIGDKVIFFGGLTQKKSGPTVGDMERRVLSDGVVFNLSDKKWICSP
jgi:hypothetical protein